MRPLLKSLLDHLVCSRTGQPHHLDESDIIIFYFSSQTCHLSSATTDGLVTYYNSVRELRSKNLDVVFISADTSEEEFYQHSSSMPWPALHFARPQLKIRLSNLYRVTSLPYMVFVDSKTDKVILKGGPEILDNEATKIQFPFEMKSLPKLLSTSKMVDSEGKEVVCEEVNKGYLAIYFAANWCPPCKSFTSQLKQFYEEMRNKREDFQVLFVSSDRCETSWNQIREPMPWLSIAWDDETSRRDLTVSLEIKGIPALVLLDKNLSIVSSNCKSHLREELRVEKFPWKLSNIEVLREIHMPFILEKPSVILLTDGEDADVRLGIDVLSAVSEDYYSKNSKESMSSLVFFVAGEDAMSDWLRDYINIDDVVPLLLLVDIAEGVKYEFSADVELTSETIANFISRYLNNDLDGLLLESARTV